MNMCNKQDYYNYQKLFRFNPLLIITDALENKNACQAKKYSLNKGAKYKNLLCKGGFCIIN
ncbi:hypothetical protein GCM10027043_24730 [Ferruginibacter profundus]